MHFGYADALCPYLPTRKTEPAGNKFTHVFNATGRLTDATDQAGGHWKFGKSVSADGTAVSTVRVASDFANLTEGYYTDVSYTDKTDSTGKYTSDIVSASGETVKFTRSADGMTINRDILCGAATKFQTVIKNDLDPMYKFLYPKEITETTGGKTRTTSFARLYEEKNTSGVPQKITETVTVKNKPPFTVVDNIGTGIRTMTSPEGRTVTS